MREHGSVGADPVNLCEPCQNALKAPQLAGDLAAGTSLTAAVSGGCPVLHKDFCYNRLIYTQERK